MDKRSAKRRSFLTVHVMAKRSRLAALLCARVFVMRDRKLTARQQKTVTSVAKPVRIKENQGWACFSFFRYAVSSFRSPD
jgi:hypothetical protein